MISAWNHHAAWKVVRVAGVLLSVIWGFFHPSVEPLAQENAYKLTWYSKDADMSLRLTDIDLRMIFDTHETVVAWSKTELAVYLTIGTRADTSCIPRVSLELDAVLAELKANLSRTFARVADPQHADIIIDVGGVHDPDYRTPSRIRSRAPSVTLRRRGDDSAGSFIAIDFYDISSSTIEFAYLFDRTLCREDEPGLLERNLRWDLKRSLLGALTPTGPNYERLPSITAPSWISWSQAPAVKLFDYAGLRAGQRMRAHWQEYAAEVKRKLTVARE